jgi:hypothetical protein
MQTPDTDDDIQFYRLSSVRTCGIYDDPQFAILEVTSTLGTLHFRLHIKDLAALGLRLTLDAQILDGQAEALIETNH